MAALLEERFSALAEEWRQRTGHLSNLTKMFADPAYQEIISMDWDVVPVILRSLEKKPDHWFWALREITGENPVPLEHAGHVAKMAQDWVEWGRAKGLL
jgi:hypothetical protein